MTKWNPVALTATEARDLYHLLGLVDRMTPEGFAEFGPFTSPKGTLQTLKARVELRGTGRLL